MPESVSNPIRVSNSQALPYWGDEYFAQQDFIHKIKSQYIELMFGDQLSDGEKWYMFVGNYYQKELYKRYFLEIAKAKNLYDKTAKKGFVKPPESQHYR